MFLVLAWATSAVFMGTGTSFLGSPFSLSIEWRGGWFDNLGSDKPEVEQRLSCFLRDLVRDPFSCLNLGFLVSKMCTVMELFGGL